MDEQRLKTVESANGVQTCGAGGNGFDFFKGKGCELPKPFCFLRRTLGEARKKRVLQWVPPEFRRQAFPKKSAAAVRRFFIRGRKLSEKKKQSEGYSSAPPKAKGSGETAPKPFWKAEGFLLLKEL